MESYISNDKCVAKYVHDDGSETSIKTWPDGISCGGSGRKKFNVFISSSVGCRVTCRFCYLTSKHFGWHPLSPSAVADNVIEAIEAEFIRRPELKDIPMNLSFMGMGDAWYNLCHTYNVVSYVIEHFGNQLIEGVDIGTTLPQIKPSDTHYLEQIDQILKATGRLVERPIERSAIRIFYSLHCADGAIRQTLIPNTFKPIVALPYFIGINKEYKFNIIFHVILLDGINDSDYNIKLIIDMVNTCNAQLRLLRFNQCPDSVFAESKRFDEVVNIFKVSVNDFKYQLSPGSEVAAACGMFLMKNSIERK